MKNKLVCISAANKESRINYEKTVLTPINLTNLKTKFKSLSIPPDIENASIWGVRWEKIWNDINIGDIGLFYANFRFIGYGTIKGKLKSDDIAEYLWDASEYRHLLIFSPIVEIDCSREKFWKAFNYAPRLYIQGVRIPFVKRQKELLREYGSIQCFLKEALDLSEIRLPDSFNE